MRSQRVDEILPGVWHWTLADDRIGFRSDAYAVRGKAGVVLIDPLPLAPAALARLGGAQASCLSGAFHQRSAWRYRSELGVPVIAPAGAAGLEQVPDEQFGDGDVLPGGLRAIRAHGPTNPHFAFMLETVEGVRILFVGDLLMRAGEERFALVPDDHQDDPRATRQAVRALLRLEPDVLCPAHGAPCLSAGREAILDTLRSGG